MVQPQKKVGGEVRIGHVRQERDPDPKVVVYMVSDGAISNNQTEETTTHHPNNPSK